jgi:hypothetical protein
MHLRYQVFLGQSDVGCLVCYSGVKHMQLTTLCDRLGPMTSPCATVL